VRCGNTAEEYMKKYVMLILGLLICLLCVGVANALQPNVQAYRNITIDAVLNGTFSVLNINSSAINITFTNYTIPVSDVYSNFTANYKVANMGNLTVIVQPNENLTIRDGGCDTVPVENQSLSGIKTLCGGLYNFARGNQTISAGNTLINCNFTQFVGNNISGTFGFDNNGNANVTIQGCNVSNYDVNIRNRGQNDLTQNNFVGDSRTTGIDMGGTGLFNITIFNNVVTTVSSVWNNTGIFILKGVNVNVSNNNISGGKYGVLLQASNNSVVNNNLFYNQRYIGFYTSTFVPLIPWGLQMSNNNFTNQDQGIVLQNSSNVNIASTNTFSNISLNTDFYNTAIHLFLNNNNITIGGILGYGHTGVLVQKSTNVIINNVTCNQMSFAETTSVNSGVWIDAYEPRSCIFLAEIYKGYLGDSSENRSDNFTKFNSYNSTNVAISNISYNSNVQVNLRTQGSNYVTTDFVIGSYWWQSFQMSTNFTGADIFYNNLHFINISVQTNLTLNSNVLHKNYPTNSIASDNFMNYSLSKSVSNFVNTGLNVLSFSLFSYLQNYPFNDVLNVSTNTVLSFNVDNFSITLSPNQQILVGDFTNLTSVSFVPPSDTNGAIISRNNIIANISIVGQGFSNVTTFLYSNSGLYTSNFSTSNKTYINFSNLPPDTYYMNATAYDLAGVAYSTSTTNIIISGASNCIPIYSSLQRDITCNINGCSFVGTSCTDWR
jgi:parallel beta-helix repeat protein